MADSPLSEPTASASDLLVEVLGSNQTWADLVDAFNSVVEINIDDPIFQLERIRFITQDSEQEMLKATARMLGFDESQDVLNLNSDSLTRLVSQLPLYPDQNSTIYFPNFIDVLLNSSIAVSYLFTRDYVNFRPVPQGALITDNGQWFKSTHIGLTVALLSLESLLLPPGKTLLSRVKELFFSYSPIALVIEHVRFAVILDDWPGGSAFGVTTKLIGGNAYTVLE